MKSIASDCRLLLARPCMSGAFVSGTCSLLSVRVSAVADLENGGGRFG